MIEFLASCALGIGATSASLALVLAVRRMWFHLLERRRQGLDARLGPLALSLIQGGEVDDQLSGPEVRLLAELVARYARILSGETRAHIANFFERIGHVDREIGALSDRRATRRATAAYMLGEMASRRAVPALLASLEDPERDVRASAVRSLGRLGAPEAVLRIVRALSRREIPTVIGAQSLLAIGSASVSPVRRMLADQDGEVRAVAVEVLGLLGGGSEARLLVKRLRDDSAEVRAKAARALGRIGAGGAARQLEAALDDRVPFVRAVAATALGAIGDRRAVESLLAQARNDAFWPARAAAHALVRIEPEALAAAAGHPGAGPHVRESAVLAALQVG